VSNKIFPDLEIQKLHRVQEIEKIVGSENPEAVS
jgi:hypothetical protein